MDCPYCLEEVSEEALVCKNCTRDLYLFKPMMARVEELEKQIANTHKQEAYEERIEELELLLEEHEHRYAQRSLVKWVVDVALYLVAPLILLLLAHWLITVVYDTKMIYLRIISMALPLPFAFILFKYHAHKLLPWFFGVVFLAVASVIGMSWITSQVDHSPVWPQSAYEWKEVLEYSASIAFSFLTGMLLGGMVYKNKNLRRRSAMINPLIKTVSESLKGDGISLNVVHRSMKTLQEYGGTIVALGTTLASIYTGLKGVITGL